MGNLSSKRDWGHAKDYVRAMYAILQQDEPSDYVIATGITTTIRDFIRMAFEEIGVGIRFKGEGIDEVAILESIDEGCSSRRLVMPIWKTLRNVWVRKL